MESKKYIATCTNKKIWRDIITQIQTDDNNLCISSGEDYLLMLTDLDKN
jgi:hypothetical protein